MVLWEDLIEESCRLEDIASKIQVGEDVGLPAEEIKTLENEYLAWFGRCLSALPEDLRDKFRVDYEGTFWSSKIKRFFEAATEVSPFRPDDEASRKLFSYWAYPFKQNFYPYIRNQRQMLLEASNRRNISVEEAAPWNETVRRIFKVFIEKAGKAKTAHEKKLTFEYLAIFLIGSVEGLTIIGHDERGVAEEVDVWVSNESNHPFWQKMPAAFIVECKNWGDPVGVPELRTLTAIMGDKNIKLAILLAKNGITGDRSRDAGDIVRNAFRDGKYIVVLTEVELLEIANGLPPTDAIKRKYLDLYMKS